ncbi:hypothetical protein GCM10007304_10460 [Rhodococcoides trifolii]|uniref:Uncharacterized protein n=1 Tax=Rhodococcoides trifolii TaxID=908250 RepID=A0A917CUT9_9NOCA|nr:hypothetical protein [Rhodococcus trifolii]GGF98361.1 hypothetical protein GCM10007304_10460 [Rhodococcus trifolii]
MSDRYPREPDGYGYGDDRTRAYATQPGQPGKPQAGTPKFDVGPFVGGVVATAIVAFVAGWVATLIVQAIYQRTGTNVAWIYGADDPWLAGVYGALAALLAGALLLLLFQAVPSPNTFFSWIVGLITVAIIVLPFLAAGAVVEAIGAAVVNGLMGFAILALLSTTAARTYRG